MPNTHLEHPEELLLTGGMWVLEALAKPTSVSLKIDGAPAIVWGIHPENGNFFVGTKSVFNKKKIKIAYTHDDVLEYYGHSANLCRILFAALDCLPRVPGIYQGDFIGFGGSDTYQPNVVTYVFPEVITKAIIIAPHTQYEVPGHMSEAQASPITEVMPECDDVHWIEPIVDFPRQDPKYSHVDNYSGVKFLTESEAQRVKTRVNQRLRQEDLTHLIANPGLAMEEIQSVIGDPTLAALYMQVCLMKNVLLDQAIVRNCPKAYLGTKEIMGEGLVIHSGFGAGGGSFKCIKRAEFSAANFKHGRFSK